MYSILFFHFFSEYHPNFQKMPPLQGHMTKIFLFAFYLICNASFAQYILKGTIYENESLTTVPNVNIVVDKKHYSTSDAHGKYSLEFEKPGEYILKISNIAFKNLEQKVVIKKRVTVKNFDLVQDNTILSEFVLTDESDRDPIERIAIARLKSIEGTTINAGKKNEVIKLSKSNFNTATNNSRQIYAEVPGLNIWESDQTGLQLEIGARGLSPQRTSNFNTRQNYYDISADALGYPESYYTPPSQAVDRIQLIRGAASLQYGPQFGGMLNFIMKKGPEDKKLELTASQSLGSNQLSSTFLSAGGQIKKTNYYVFGQYKTAKGWRPNSSLDSYTLFGGISHKFSKKLTLKLEYSRLFYTAQQPGGLTDLQFQEDPSQSNRSGNWFQVNWNVFSTRLEYKLSTNTEISSQFFGLYAQRNALGYLQDISASEDKLEELTNRDLILSTFKNFGNETKMLHRYSIKNNISALLLGVRYYQGNTQKDQGFGPDGKSDNFTFNDKRNENGSFYTFPSQNLAFFAENIFQINPVWNVTPGVRYEIINTESDGFSQVQNPNNPSEIIQYNNSKDLSRNVLLYGIGTSYKTSENTEFYSNFSKNYRAVNFNDLYTINPNIVIDSNLNDESGFNFDLGVRGRVGNLLTFDASVYYLKYADRIGFVKKLYPEGHPLQFITYSYKTNISDSRTFGTEIFMSLNLIPNSKKKDQELRWFANVTLQDGRYVNSDESSIQDKKVESVPNFTLKTGLVFKYKNLSGSLMYTHVGEQFSDAQNTKIADQRSLYGIIPSYQVLDLSMKYRFKNNWIMGGGINNITNESYFTRRATGYPGPGIVPSPNRNFYISLEKKI